MAVVHAAAAASRSPGAWLALSAIGLYRRYLSPHKGYHCAWRVHTGGCSCSAYGERVIGRHGLPVGLALLRRRFARCAEVHRQHRQARDAHAGAMRLAHAQRGVCDFDLPCHVDAGDCCNVVTCCDFPCGGGRRERTSTSKADRARRRRRGQPASHPTRRP